VAHLVRDSIYGFFSLLHRKPVKHIYEVAPHCRWAWGIILATLPTGVIGILFKDWFESLFGSLHTVGYELLANSLLLWLTRYFKKGEKGIEQGRWFDFLIIGTLQAVSIVPGISRSGATIAGALFLGFNRETAFRFSFLLAIPAILGASLLELRDGLGGPDSWGANGIGFAVAALSGMVAIFVLAKIVRQGKLHNFAFYTLPFGLLILYTSRFLD
jgi:undecaprenyl-diphosphatase